MKIYDEENIMSSCRVEARNSKCIFQLIHIYQVLIMIIPILMIKKFQKKKPQEENFGVKNEKNM